MRQFIEINTDHMKPPQVGDDLFVNRASFAAMHRQTVPAEVSLYVSGYNRVEKTKRCVESILEYTKGIDYELILIDNGSQDETLDYYRSVQHDKKKIIHITKNCGAIYTNYVLMPNELGSFICGVPNDIIVTPRWLENLLICMKSDTRIGMVNAVSSNASNLQEGELTYRSYKEMQRKADAFNHSDPKKWEERMRLITLASLYRKEVLLASGWPLSDVGFFHDFADDDVSFKIRRLGYRIVLAGDTWICHDHNIWQQEAKDPAEYQCSLEIGKANFQEKYYGIDAWEDTCNYLRPYMGHFPMPKKMKCAFVLGVDVRCGTPILDIKNWLRKAGIFETNLSAYTQDSKYWLDLKTICQGTVVCDREEFLIDAFPSEYYDYVVVDRPLNRYHEPQKLLNDIFSLCKRNGIVVCKLKNTFSFQGYVHMLGQREVYDQEFAYDIPVGAVQSALEKWGTIKSIVATSFNLGSDQRQALDGLLPAELPREHREELMKRLLCNEYLFIVQKR